MKHTVRIFSLCISVAMLVPLLLSCEINQTLIPPALTGDAAITNEVLESTASGTEDGPGADKAVTEDGNALKVVYPEIAVSTFKFELADDVMEACKGKISDIKQMFDENEEVSEDEFRGALYDIISLDAYASTQRDIAYMLYLYDISSEAAWDDYMYAYNLSEDISNLFFDFYNEYKKQSHAFSAVLKEVVSEEYSLRTSYSNVDSFERKMEALEGEYNSLINDAGSSDEDIFKVYKKYMSAAYSLAVSSKTNNYYEYASELVYNRNDTAAQRAALRRYTKKYLVPLCRELRAKSKAHDSKISSYMYARSNEYLYNRYDSFGENYMFDYFSSLAKSSGDAMRTAFEMDRIFVGDGANSWKSASVFMVGKTPICYFHESELKLDTVAHELGHYYEDIAGAEENCSYDLKEVHSCANAILLYSYLSDRLDNDGFTNAELYMLYNWMYQTVLSVIKDEFDEAIYARNPSTLKLEEFERIMSDLIDEYNVRDLSNGIENQLMTYWKRLGIDYPMKNYCYATAMISAFQIYAKSKDDYAGATEIYRKIVEEPRDGGDFEATIVNAGLTTPYDEQTYIELNTLAEPN